MEYKDLFKLLKKHLGDGDTVPSFHRNLIAMITELPEDNWYGKDLSMINADETLTNYAKRGLSKKLAQKILNTLTIEYLIERIDEKSDTQKALMAEDFRAYDSSVNQDNVSQKVADWLVECIQKLAGVTPNNVLEKEKQQEISLSLKSRYGNYLLDETKGVCPCCGKELIITKNGNAAYVYDVIIIDKSKDPVPENILAACPTCYGLYLVDDSKKSCKKLKEKKNILVTQKQIALSLDDLPLDKGIANVIKGIKNLNEKDFGEATLEPKELNKKIDSSKEFVLYNTVNNYVMTYFIKIREIFINLDKRKEIDYEEVQDQMRAIYRRLNKPSRSQQEIFLEISKKIQRVTLQDEILCQIVVSYFIQSCEVF